MESDGGFGFCHYRNIKMLQIPSLVLSAATDPPGFFPAVLKKHDHIYTCTVYANTTQPLKDLGIQDGFFFFIFFMMNRFQMNFIVLVEIFNDCSCTENVQTCTTVAGLWET